MNIGITGGIGTGKSVVSRILRTKGYQVYDCDLEARRIMEASGDLKNAIRQKLGNSCLHADGSLNRDEIARCIFSNDECRLWLNSKVHGLVLEDVDAVSRLCDDGPFFIESAIPMSSGLWRLCSEIWVVSAPEQVRIQRVIERDKSDRSHILARMRSQENELSALPETVRICHIENDGTKAILPQLEYLIENK